MIYNSSFFPYCDRYIITSGLNYNWPVAERARPWPRGRCAFVVFFLFFMTILLFSEKFLIRIGRGRRLTIRKCRRILCKSAPFSPKSPASLFFFFFFLRVKRGKEFLEMTRALLTLISIGATTTTKERKERRRKFRIPRPAGEIRYGTSHQRAKRCKVTRSVKQPTTREFKKNIFITPEFRTAIS